MTRTLLRATTKDALRIIITEHPGEPAPFCVAVERDPPAPAGAAAWATTLPLAQEVARALCEDIRRRAAEMPQGRLALGAGRAA